MKVQVMSSWRSILSKNHQNRSYPQVILTTSKFAQDLRARSRKSFREFKHLANTFVECSRMGASFTPLDFWCSSKYRRTLSGSKVPEDSSDFDETWTELIVMTWTFIWATLRLFRPKIIFRIPPAGQKYFPESRRPIFFPNPTTKFDEVRRSSTVFRRFFDEVRRSSTKFEPFDDEVTEASSLLRKASIFPSGGEL